MSTGRATMVPSLNGMRALSVLAVFVGHAELIRISPAPLGVTVFFFLSGYLITTLLRVEHERSGGISLRQFYLRRTFRIMPSMYLVLALAAAVGLLGLVGSGDAGGVVSAGAFTANFAQAFGWPVVLPTGTGPFWSLAVEEHFYLLFPLLYIVLQKTLPSRTGQFAVLGGICALILAWRIVLVAADPSPSTFTRIYYSTDTRADSILLGCMLAIGLNPFLGDVRPSRRVSLWLFPAGVALMLGAAALPDVLGRTVGFTLTGLACWLIFIPIIAHPTTWFGRILNWRPLAYVGVLSYGMYLVQSLLATALDELFGLHGVPLLLLNLVLSVAAAHGLHRLVERPMGRLRTRVAARSGTSRPAPRPAVDVPVPTAALPIA